MPVREAVSTGAGQAIVKTAKKNSTTLPLAPGVPNALAALSLYTQRELLCHAERCRTALWDMHPPPPFYSS
ncbi:hypothetical protein AOLI_G00311790 [Acnodon oligacanthus]